MRLSMHAKKLDKIVELVQEYVDWSRADIEDFIDGGEEGWDCGDDEQQGWLDESSAAEIASWCIAGHTPKNG